MSSITPLARGNLVAALGTLIWATSFPATDLLLQNWSPTPLAALRLLLAGISTAAMAFFLGECRLWRQAPKLDILLLGSLGVGGSIGLVIMGQKTTGAAIAAILGTSLPVMTALMDLRAGAKVGPNLVLGIVLAVSGAILVCLDPSLTGFALRGGEPLLLGGIFLWAWYSRNAGRRLAALPAASQASLTLLTGSCFLMLVSAIASALGLMEIHTSWTPPELALAFWMGGVAVGLSLPLWLVAVRLLGLTTASIHQNMAPVYVLLIGVLLGGGFPLQQALGAALVIAGAVIAQLQRTSTAVRPATAEET